MYSKPLAKTLDAGYRYRPHEMLGFFLSEMLRAAGALPQSGRDTPADIQEQIRQAMDEYLRTVHNEQPFTDILGPLYMELACRGGKAVLGQYFTPEPVARMMAMMTLDDAAGRAKPGGGLWTAIDPACGSGVMMLSTCGEILARHGTRALRYWSITGVDLDPICARMFAVQMLANLSVFHLTLGEILVLNGNSLGHDADLALIVHGTHPAVQPVVPAQHPARREMIRAAAEAAGIEQLSLFALNEAV